MSVVERLAALLLLTCSTSVVEATERSRGARAEFVKVNPCPATGKRSGACAGYVVDHVVPLACGGVDAPANMQWQTRQAAAEKDRIERRGCSRGARSSGA